MKPPIHLVMNRPTRPAPDDEVALFRARGRALNRERHRAALRSWFALGTRTVSVAGSESVTSSPATTKRPGPAPARPA